MNGEGGMGRHLYSVLLVAFTGSLCGGEAVYDILDSAAAFGQRGVRVGIAASFPQPAQGFSMALRHDCRTCNIWGMTIENTIVEAADFASLTVDPESRTMVIGLLMDGSPPFDGELIPALDDPQPVLYLLLDVEEEALAGKYLFSFVPEGLPSGAAWVRNVYAAANESIAVTDLHGGILTLQEGPADGIPLFLRGDGNQDLAIDVSDAVFILGYLYRNEHVPRCLDACDTNDDGDLDIGDAIYVLSLLFDNGPLPPIPRGQPGIDWTPDDLTCDDPRAGYTTEVPGGY